VFGSSSSDGVVDRTRWIAAMPECFGHGLENIHLDLYPEEYIALFNVTIPPFDTIAWSNFNSKWCVYAWYKAYTEQHLFGYI
jgi:hypothetical protein